MFFVSFVVTSCLWYIEPLMKFLASRDHRKKVNSRPAAHQTEAVHDLDQK